MTTAREDFLPTHSKSKLLKEKTSTNLLIKTPRERLDIQNSGLPIEPWLKQRQPR
jgi:hypothetical protein